MSHIIIREYVDEIKTLHNKLYSVFNEAHKISRRYVSIDNNVFDVNRNHAVLFVDFGTMQPKNAIEGYFVLGKFILRFLKIKIEYAALFPVLKHNSNFVFVNKGIKIEELQRLKQEKEKVFLSFKNSQNDTYNFSFYSVEVLKCNKTFCFDTMVELGKPYVDFSDVKSLSVCRVPDNIKDKKYPLQCLEDITLIKKTNGAYCVLFAEKSILRSPIKVLRWFPQRRKEIVLESVVIEKRKERLRIYKNRQVDTSGNKQLDTNTIQTIGKMTKTIEQLEESENLIGDVFYSLGYLYEFSCRGLYRFMMENDSRLLLGTIENGNIKILDGINFFLISDFNYPLCLSKIPLK